VLLGRIQHTIGLFSIASSIGRAGKFDSILLPFLLGSANEECRIDGIPAIVAFSQYLDLRRLHVNARGIGTAHPTVSQIPLYPTIYLWSRARDFGSKSPRTFFFVLVLLPVTLFSDTILPFRRSLRALTIVQLDSRSFSSSIHHPQSLRIIIRLMQLTTLLILFRARPGSLDTCRPHSANLESSI
jgi:hypothetical protein